MKNSIKTIKMLSLAFASHLFFNCSKDEEGKPVQPQQQTIAQIASANPNLTSLVAALERASLTSVVANPGNLTVFAPTNAAFTAFLNTNGFANLNAVPIPLLTEVLKNHVLGTEVFSSALTTGYVKTLGKGSASSTNTLSLYVDLTSGVRLNGVSSVVLTSANIDASNGVIHVVDAVIGLPTIVIHATANSNFTSLVSALTRANDTMTDFVTVLSGTGPFTVFAPTNTAFSNFFTEISPLTFSTVPEMVLDKTLKYHVVSGNILAAGLPASGTAIQTILGTGAANSFTYLTVPSRLQDTRNRVCNITFTDVQCANGVIHVLDKVLFPN